jgi:hypothetical protein
MENTAPEFNHDADCKELRFVCEFNDAFNVYNTILTAPTLSLNIHYKSPEILQRAFIDCVHYYKCESIIIDKMQFIAPALRLHNVCMTAAL